MNDNKSPKVVFDKIADELANGRYDEFFTDPRGGFYPSLHWCEVSLARGEWPEYREHIESYIDQSKEILKLVEENGWTKEVRKQARNLSEKIRGHSW